MDTVDGETLNHLLLDNAAQLLLQKRRQNVEHFRSELDDIIEKYSQEFDGDEIDIFAMDVVDDRGHLRNMQHELDPVARHEPEDSENSTHVESYVEQIMSTEASEKGQDSDDSLDELSAQFYTTPEPMRRKRPSPAQSNKENQRPILVDVTAASTSEYTSEDRGPVSIPPLLVSAQVPGISSTVNLNTDTISAVQAFLAMGKQLETLLQAAVQPTLVGPTAPVAQTIRETLPSQKRRRVEDAVQVRVGVSSQGNTHEQTARQIFPALDVGQGSTSDRINEQRRRANTPDNCSIWQPSTSDNLYHKPKSTFFGAQARKPYRRRQPPAPSARSNLRNEVSGRSSESDEQTTGSESTSRAQAGETSAPMNHAENSSDSRGPTPIDRSQSSQDKLSNIFKKRPGRPAALFTPEEDSLLVELCAKHVAWREIEASFPGKTPYQVIYHYRTHLRPRMLDEEGQSSADDSRSLHLDVTQDDVNMISLDDVEDNSANPPSPPKSLPNLKSKRHRLAYQSVSSPSRHIDAVRRHQRRTIHPHTRFQHVAIEMHTDSGADDNQYVEEQHDDAVVQIQSTDVALHLGDASNKTIIKDFTALHDRPHTAQEFRAEGLLDQVRTVLQSGAHTAPDFLQSSDTTSLPSTKSTSKHTSTPAQSVLRSATRQGQFAASTTRQIGGGEMADGPNPLLGTEEGIPNTPSSITNSRSNLPVSKIGETSTSASVSKAAKGKTASRKRKTAHRLSPASVAAARRRKRSNRCRISQFMAGNSDGDLTSDDDLVHIRSSPSRIKLPRGGVIKVEP